MNCHQAESAIALEVGNDLDESALEELTTHLARCPECRAYQRQLSKAVDVLQSPAEERPWSPDDSVWPGVANYLAKSAQPASLRRHFNGWTPAMTVVAACAVMVVISILRPSEVQPTSTYYINGPSPSLQSPIVWPKDFPNPNVVAPNRVPGQLQLRDGRVENEDAQYDGVELIESGPLSSGYVER